MARNQWPEAVAFLEKTASIFPHPNFVGLMAWVYGHVGRREDALRVLDELTERSKHSYVSPLAFAWIYQGLDDREPWRKWMQATFDERSGLMAFLNAAWNDPVRSDPFFQELVRKVGLPS